MLQVYLINVPDTREDALSRVPAERDVSSNRCASVHRQSSKRKTGTSLVRIFSKRRLLAAPDSALSGSDYEQFKLLKKVSQIGDGIGVLLVFESLWCWADRGCVVICCGEPWNDMGLLGAI